MNAAIPNEFYAVEPGALPRGVRFYAQRRQLERSGPIKAFLVGVMIGVTATIYAGLLLAVFSGISGCSSAPAESASRKAERLRGVGPVLVLPSVGKSMLPSIPDRCPARINTEAKFSDIKSADVLVFVSSKHPGVLVEHRAFKRLAGGWWTKGDNNRSPDDELVTPENFVGIVDLSLVSP